MTALIQDDIVDRVLDATDIVEVIGARLPLKKAGRNYKANCPFHQEKSPSFIVSHDKQIYHCFGCGQGGNVIGFLMKYENLTFRETLKLLADKAGLQLPARQFSQGGEENSFFEKLYALNGEALKFFNQNLSEQEGSACYRYFQGRGLSDDTIKLFGLGYSLNAWDGLLSHLAANKEDPAMIEKAGLIIARENKGGHYDRFRNRAMFPIVDVHQHVIGFGARALDDSEPKYINSPETPVYNKSRNLFGLNQTKGFIKEKGYAIIVEGYLDLIVPFQYGVKNIVATLGTALTGEQIKLLKRYTQTVVLVFDPDTAGEDASLRGLDILVASDMNVRVATLPKDVDPDTFVKQHGAEAFDRIVSASKDLFDYKMGILMAKFNKDGVRGRAAIATLMLPTISRIPNEILKSSFMKKLSEVLSIDEPALKAEMSKIKKDYSYSVTFNEARAPVKKNVRSAELLLLGLVLEDPGCLRVIEKDLGCGEFRDDCVARVVSLVRENQAGGREVVPSKLIASFDDDETKNIIARAIGSLENMSDRNKVMHDCLESIRRDNLNEALHSLRSEIRRAEEVHNSDLVTSLMVKYNELLKIHKG